MTSAARAIGAAACLVLAAAAAGAAPPAPEVVTFLETWRSAWERQDLEAYLALHADDVRSGGRDLAALRAHKAGVFARAETAVISIGDVDAQDVAIGGETLLAVRFDQDYRSASLSDFGRKELLLRRRGESFVIVRETWRAADGTIEVPLGGAAAAPAAAARPSDDEDDFRPLTADAYAPPAPAPAASADVEDLLRLAPLQPTSPVPREPEIPGLPGSEAGRDIVEEIVARVNGRVLTRSMFLERIDLNYERLLLDDPPDLAERIGTLAHDTLETTIDRWLLLQEAEDRQADIEGFWRDWLVQFRHQVGAEDMAEVEKLLSEQGTTLEKLREQVVESEVPNLFIHREILERIDLSDDRLKEHYASNPARWQLPPHVTLRQVLVPIAAGESPDRAAAIVEQALARLEAGEDWCEVQAVFGQGPRCGDVGTVALTDLLPELRDGAAGLPIGAVSKPIRSTVGLHLVQVTAREATRLLPFEDVKDRVREDAFETARDARLAELIDDLRRRGQVDVSERYEKLQAGAAAEASR